MRVLFSSHSCINRRLGRVAFSIRCHCSRSGGFLFGFCSLNLSLGGFYLPFCLAASNFRHPGGMCPVVGLLGSREIDHFIGVMA